MSPADATPLAGLASGMLVIGIVLFRMPDDKKKSMDDDADSTYGAIRKRVLEPALLSIIESRRGRIKIKDLFMDPGVVTRLEAYKKVLFEYNESGSRRGSVSAHLGLGWKVSLFTAGAVCLVQGADALAASLSLSGHLPAVTPAVGGSAAVLGSAAVCYTLWRYSSEDRAFRREVRKIRSSAS